MKQRKQQQTSRLEVNVKDQLKVYDNGVVDNDHGLHLYKENYSESSGFLPGNRMNIDLTKVQRSIRLPCLQKTSGIPPIQHHCVNSGDNVRAPQQGQLEENAVLVFDYAKDCFLRICNKQIRLNERAHWHSRHNDHEDKIASLINPGSHFTQRKSRLRCL